MRDLETTHIEIAETDYVVFGTLHTTTAISTIDRFIDQFPADQQQQIPTMTASTLKGVIAQNILKKKGGGRTSEVASARLGELELLFGPQQVLDEQGRGGKVDASSGPYQFLAQGAQGAKPPGDAVRGKRGSRNPARPSK